MSHPEFHIADRPVGPDHPPLVIAEMSGNHNQSLERALAIVDAAADAGAHAIKLQTYTADSMTLDLEGGEFTISDPASLWAGQSLHRLYQQAHTPRDWHAPIFQRARQRGILAFSSPFDPEAVDYLESLDAPAYKIASFEMTDLPLLRRAAATGKPLIISTGMARLDEIDLSVRTARAAGARRIALLRCTSSYPADPRQSDLRTLPHLASAFDLPVGLSDHTRGLGAAVAAVALGACLIEKHFTLRRADGGVDSAFSLEPAELAQLVRESQHAWQALGRVRYGPTASEEKSLVFRRSIYVVRDLPAGHALTPDDIRIIRPGLGLEPRHYDRVLGRRTAIALTRGKALQWTDLA